MACGEWEWEATPPERYRDTIDFSALKADFRRALGNVFSGLKHKNSLKPKRGSKKYLHLQKFIERRRQKKLEKRCTLDPSAQVTLPINFVGNDDDDMMMMMMTTMMMMIM